MCTIAVEVFQGTYANGKINIYGQVLKGDADTGPGLMCVDTATGKVDRVNEDINGLSNSRPLVVGDSGIMRGPQYF